jgi:hypothetical protein
LTKCPFQVKQKQPGNLLPRDSSCLSSTCEILLNFHLCLFSCEGLWRREILTRACSYVIQNRIGEMIISPPCVAATPCSCNPICVNIGIVLHVSSRVPLWRRKGNGSYKFCLLASDAAVGWGLRFGEIFCFHVEKFEDGGHNFLSHRRRL